VRLFTGFEQKVDGGGGGALSGLCRVSERFPEVSSFGMRRETKQSDHLIAR
jgi:hypothetical protein